MAIVFEISSRNAESVRLEIERIPETAMRAADRTLGLATTWLTSEIQEKKLSGQVLQVQTGNLRRSLSPKRIAEGKWRVVIGAEGWYGVLHEYGYKRGIGWRIDSPIRGRDGRWFYIGRHPGLKERSFLRSALYERRERIRSWVERDIAAAINKRLGGKR